MIIHYHHCPACYEHYECEMDCTIEPDLEQDGKQFGAHCVCPVCENKEHLTKTGTYTQEWFARYYGVIR